MRWFKRKPNVKTKTRYHSKLTLTLVCGEVKVWHMYGWDEDEIVLCEVYSEWYKGDDRALEIAENGTTWVIDRKYIYTSKMEVYTTEVEDE